MELNQIELKLYVWIALVVFLRILIKVNSRRRELTRSKFKVTEGLAQLITTGEPVYVRGFADAVLNPESESPETIKVAIVSRPVVTQNGIIHQEEEIPLVELETRFEQVKRNIEFEQYVQTLREEAEAKRYSLPAGVKEALMNQAPNPSVAKQLSFEGVK